MVVGSKKTPNCSGRLDGCGGVIERGAEGVMVTPSWDAGRDRFRVEVLY